MLLSLAGALLWRKQVGDPFQVNSKEGAAGNVIWFRVDATRYALLYSHEDRFIKLLAGGRRGQLVSTFTNATPASEVARIFAGLGDGIATPSESRKVRRDRETERAEKAERRRHREARKAARAAGKPDPRVPPPVSLHATGPVAAAAAGVG